MGRQRGDTLMDIGVVLDMLGGRDREGVKVLTLRDCIGRKSTIERDVADEGLKDKMLHFADPRIRVRVLGVDGIGRRLAKLVGSNVLVCYRLCRTKKNATF